MAINFPSTAGQATDGTFTYVVAGITYSWNGESWVAAGSGATATDLTVFSASTTTASGGGSLSYDSNTGDFELTPPDLSSFLTSTGSIQTHTDVAFSVTPTGGDLLQFNDTTSAWDTWTPDYVRSAEATTFTSDITFEGAVTIGTLSGGSDLKLHVGNSNYLKIFGSGNEAYIRNIDNNGGAGGGGLNIAARTTLGLYSGGTGGSYLTFVGDSNGAAKLYYQTLEKLTTTATGVDVTGALTVNGTSTFTRQTVSYTATNLNNGASVDFNLTTGASYALLKVDTSHACWLTLYTDTTSRTNDASRSQVTDPSPGSGVIAEVITENAESQLITPGVIGFSSTGGSQTYAKLVNNSGTQVNLQVTLTFVPLEV